MDLPVRAHIRRATRLDAEAVSDLRSEAYAGAPEFTVRDASALHWSQQDDSNIVLTAWDGEGRALSTTRGDLLTDRDEAQQHMECQLDGIPVRFPALQLGKGATRGSAAGNGLHSALRLCFLEAAVLRDVESVVGIVYDGAPRTRLMRSIGYEFYAPATYWYEDLEPRRQTLIAVLDRHDLSSAVALLSEKFGGLLSAYPCDIPELARQFDLGLSQPAG
jgi:hypothetical protein